MTTTDAEMKRYELEYKEVRDHVRHFSNVRSALTTFLMTVGLAAFAAHVTAECSVKNLNYLKLAGTTTLAMSVMTCIIFSYRTEYWNEYSKTLWKCMRGSSNSKPTGVMSKNAVCKCDVVEGMIKDPMNWVLIITIAIVSNGFFGF